MTSAATVRRSYRGLLDEIDRGARMTEDPRRAAARAPSVSEWSVQEQLEHLLLTDLAIAAGLEQGLEADDPGEAAGTPNRWGYTVLWTGHIPRARGRAPDFVLPEGKSLEEIRLGFHGARERLERLEPELERLRRLHRTIAHPVLGDFTAARWLRFGHIHHLHHNKIIRDIERAVARHAG